MDRLWGKAFKQHPTKEVIEFMAGRDVKGCKAADENLIEFDIWGTKAHVIMLWKQNIISREDVKVILKGLNEIQNLWKLGRFNLDPEREDVHTNIESFIIERYGIEYGGKIHTARSRNDQVVLDMRLYLREEALQLVDATIDLVECILEKASENLEVVMPGFTHHQHAMLTTFSHVLSSFAVAIKRDILRYRGWYNLFNRCPLGGVSSYSTTFPIDRELTSHMLGFDGPEPNSIDPITNRWEPETEMAFILSMAMNHLSTIAQTLILLSTTEFNMVELADQYKTGSSIMPQKKNPCSMEVIKAKAALSHGLLMSLLSIGKSNMIGYNRDTQWTKYLIMDLVRECKPSLHILKGVIETLQVKKERMYEQCNRGFITATSLLESIVQDCNLPFREAKFLIEEAVRYSEIEGSEKVTFSSLRKALKEKGIDISITQKQVDEYQDPMQIINRKRTLGGPSQDAVSLSIQTIREDLRRDKEWLEQKRKMIDEAKGRIKDIEESLNI
ncbi:MAG: argininosuccinate lyase [bacterium]|nr:argininosuccinate lyase [bacterium]